jgi:aminocarboxymuconate-semialdehyde decarboxylase
MQCRSPVDATVLMGERPFRKLDNRSWDMARRIEDMDRDGIDIQVLSPMPELLSYWLPGLDAAVLCNHINHTIADLIARRPDRFRGLGTIPMQEPALAVEHLLRCRSEFGLTGVEIGSNINGKMIGDPCFDLFYEAAESLGMCIFVHALHPVASKAIGASRQFTSFAGFPIDVAMAGTSLILEGVLERFPKLRVGLSHGGGALGAILGRLDVGWQNNDGFDARLRRPPSELARNLFYDSNVYDRAYLRHLACNIAPGHVFCGTDYPYTIMQREPAKFIESLDLDENSRESLRNGAARLFLGDSL